MSEFNMRLPDSVSFIIDRMRSCGFSARVVGGSVRDSLIGRPLGDFDITTDATPDQTKAVFSDYKTVDTGIKHGTVTLVIDGVPYEITTYRVDGDYKDNRHPDSVTFTSCLEEDLARRDFTVNAMAYSPSSGLCDPFGGRADADRRLIRAVGDPLVRFDEDALRILRALRFAAVLGFEIEDNTKNAARELSARLNSISKERIYTELKKLISGVNAYSVISEFSDILSVCLEGLVIEKLPDKERFESAGYLTRLASVIYLNSDNPAERAEGVLNALKTDKFTRTHIISVFNAYSGAALDTERGALTTLARHGREATEGALALGITLGRFNERECNTLTAAIASGKPYMISHLAIRGGDLAALGIKGEAIGDALSLLLAAVIDGKAENSKDTLIEYFQKNNR